MVIKTGSIIIMNWIIPIKTSLDVKKEQDLSINERLSSFLFRSNYELRTFGHFNCKILNNYFPFYISTGQLKKAETTIQCSLFYKRFLLELRASWVLKKSPEAVEKGVNSTTPDLQ